MPAEFVDRDDVLARIAPNMIALTHCYGAIVTLESNGQVASKGSMVLVHASQEHFIFTARHVVDAIRARAGYVFVRPAVTDEESVQGDFSPAMKFALSDTDIAWSAGNMDVAAFRAPRGLIDLAHLRWFDASTCAEAACNVRKLAGGEHPLES
jgi:hypothetical protein